MTQKHDPESSSEQVPVFQPGPQITAPTILAAPGPFQVPEHCKDNFKANVTLAAIIDAEGKARNLHFLHSHGNEIDKLAMLAAAKYRFKPGFRAGGPSGDAPVAVAQAVDLQLIGCFVTTDRDKKSKREAVYLKAITKQDLLPDSSAGQSTVFGADPEENAAPDHGPWHLYKADKDATEPKLLSYVEASYPEEARKKNVQGAVIVSVIIDSNGLPRNIKIKSTTGPEFVESAVAAVNKYRFLPALHDLQPVAVNVDVQVRFRLY